MFRMEVVGIATKEEGIGLEVCLRVGGSEVENWTVIEFVEMEVVTEDGIGVPSEEEEKGPAVSFESDVLLEQSAVAFALE